MKEEKAYIRRRGRFGALPRPLSVYTSITVYCKQHRLLDTIMEGIKHNNYALPTQSRHKLYGRCNLSLLFFTHTSVARRHQSGRASERVSERVCERAGGPSKELVHFSSLKDTWS